MTSLLLLEDDIGLVDGLRYTLEKEGYKLTVAATVKEALNYLNVHKDMDLLLLDVSLPDGTGFEVCEYVRGKKIQIPIIFLTAADEEFNVIRGLDCGGDDYITKPFKLGELCSRIRALLRRSNTNYQLNNQLSGTNPELKGGDVTIDVMGCRAYFKGTPLELTAAEYRLLCILLRNPNRVVTRQMIFESVWDGNGDFVDDNTLSVYIRRLREKIEENPSDPKYLKTARGFGYMWEEKENESVQR